MGFIFGKNSYLKDNWNKLDFIVVITGGMQLFSDSNKGSALRTIRLLRPLRSINKIKGIRVIVGSLIESLPAMVNVALFLLFIIVLFSTFGLHLFSQMYEYRCRITPEPINGEWPVVPGYNRLCNPDLDNCPANSTCGSPGI